MDDRRKHQRYLLDQNCFLTYKASVGTIVDICMGGLSCTCLEENKCGMDSLERGIDIFCEKATLFAQGLPIKILDSSVISGKVGKELKFRTCHVQFTQLENSQKNHIQELILSCAAPASVKKPRSIMAE